MLPQSIKLVTTSARARISVTKARKVINKGSDGSYLGDKETVSNLPTVTQPSTSPDNSDAIMAMLFEIRESNANSARRLDKVKRHNSAPINPRSYSLSQAASPQLGPSHTPHQTDIASQLRDPIAMLDMRKSHSQPHPSLTHHLPQGQATRGTKYKNWNTDPLSQTARLYSGLP